MRLARYAVPFCVSGVLFTTLLTVLIRHGLHQDHGTFVYPLDDAYIHLAVSRNLALHGVWGVSPSSFSGASSSPGWTVLLAVIARLFGVHLLTPLAVNVLAALGLLLFATVTLVRALPKASLLWTTAGLCVMVLVIPLPGLALIGMEHVLHSLFVLVFVTQAATVVSRPRGAELARSTVLALVLSSAAVGALRYESCFAVLAAEVLLLERRRVALALWTGLAAAAGPIAYAVYSRAHAGIALPFSVIMKSATAGGTVHAGALLSSEAAPILLLLLTLFLIRQAIRAGSGPSARPHAGSFPQAFLLISLGTVAMHALFGPMAWLMRYEAYLFALAALAFLLAAGEELDRQRAAGRIPLSPAIRWLAIAFAVPLLPLALALVHRAHHGYSDIATSVHDRYVEHLPQALFIASAMPHATVVANDIGFLAFYADQIRILDPLGLGSIEPVRLVRSHRAVDPAFMQQWATGAGAQVAILHTDFPGMDSVIPANWLPVESWCFPSNVVFQNHVETFFAPDQNAAQELRTRLGAFDLLSPEIVRYRFPADGLRPPMPVRGEVAVCPKP